MTTKVYVKVASAIFLFCLMQVLGSVVLEAIRYVSPSFFAMEGTSSVATFPPTAIALVVMITGGVSCMVMVAMKMIRPYKAFACEPQYWRMAAVGFLAALLGIFAIDLLGEKVELPNVMGKEFMAMAHNVWGIIAIALVGPVVEELVFREGVLGYMLRRGASEWLAIVVSALCFGIIHFNPAQIPFAFCISLILGVIYFKTGNVVLTSLIHIVNNSMAVVEMRVLGEEIDTFSYEQALGGVAASYAYILVAGLLSFWLLRYYWKNA